MSQIISSRRSFLIGFGALIAAPAIVRAGSLMPVKQMLILPPKISDLIFPIDGFADYSGAVLLNGEAYCFFPPKDPIASFSKGWSSNTDLVPKDINDRWERMKAREANLKQNGAFYYDRT